MIKKVLLVFVCAIALFAVLKYVNCEKQIDNAYVVSSKWETTPIISFETDQIIGTAYPGFAVSTADVRNEKVCFSLSISNSEKLIASRQVV